MSRHDVSVRLRHMLDYARKAVAFTQGRSRVDLDKDEILTLALLRLLEVIGEAARHVPSEFRTQAPPIPWRDITGMRDRLIHAYPDVDLVIVWTTVTERLPQLVAELEKLVPPETG